MGGWEINLISFHAYRCLMKSYNGLLPVVTSLGVIGEGILGERHALGLKSMVGMDAMPSRRAQRHNARRLYWRPGGVRLLTTVDNADVSGAFGIRLKDDRGSAHS